MQDSITLRELHAEEMPSTDAIYDELRFARTDPSCTRMLGAFDGDRLVGLGRLIDLGAHGGAEHFELGGMWVDASLRRTGLANRIIRGLLPWMAPDAKLWCTPFEHLMPLYGAHGFEPVPEGEAPPRLIERLAGCASAQDESVIATRWLAAST